MHRHHDEHDILARHDGRDTLAQLAATAFPVRGERAGSWWPNELAGSPEAAQRLSALGHALLDRSTPARRATASRNPGVPEPAASHRVLGERTSQIPRPSRNTPIDVAAPLGRDASAKPRILIVDDALVMRMLLEDVLTRAGYAVVTADDGVEAQRCIEAGAFDLILTDILMPGLDGIGLLRKVRERDAELPVILLTGTASTPTAIGAVNLGATAYLEKSIAPDALVAEVERALKLRRLAMARREASAHGVAQAPGIGAVTGDLAQTFERALEGLFMVYQPIVSASRREAFAYEALVRSSEPTLAHPEALFEAAEKLGRLRDLGRAIRASCAETFAEAGPRARLFVSLHADDLLDETLYDAREPLACMAQRVVFELTERARLDDIPDLAVRIATLRQAGFRIAIDDIGAGYSGLNSFALLRPEFVKLDMTLVRGIDADPTKQRIARMLVDLSTDLNIGVMAEGVNTAAERDMLVHYGCDLLQGYFFARPGAAFPEPRLHA